MEETTLLRDLAVVMVVSGAVTAVFHELRQPVVLGYILAGLLIGPHTPPFALVRDQASIETLAELGVILLLFSLGLEFNFRKLRRIGAAAAVVAALEIPLMVWLGYTTAIFAGWSTTDALFLGAILSISSTTIAVKALMELGLTGAPFARIIMGVLIFEDLAAVLILVLLSGFAAAGTVELGEVVRALGRVTLFVVTVAVIGSLLVPRVVHWLARLKVKEVLTVASLGLCFGVAILAAELGVSVALGAFLIGAVVGESTEAARVQDRIESIRDAFSAVFFVAVGMQIDPVALWEHAGLVLLLSALVVFGKLAACSFGTLVAGFPPRTAFGVGMGLGQIGEFSFIIANLGLEAGVVSGFLYPITVGVSVVTTFLTPYRVRAMRPIADAVERVAPRPLQEFLGFYRGRLSGGGRWRIPDDARRPTVRAVISGILLLALLLVARGAAAAARRRFPEAIVFPADVEVLVWTICGVVSFPLVVGLFRTAGELGMALSRRLSGRDEGSRVLAETFRFVFTVIGGALFLAIASPVIPSGFPLLVTIALVAIAGVVLWRSVVDVQEHSEAVLGEIFSAERPEVETVAAEAKSGLARLVSDKYPFEVVLEDLILPFGETAANRRIRELALRSRTGATIAAIYRGDEAIVNPDPETPLQPGDVLVLLGSREQVTRAMHEIERLAAHRPSGVDAPLPRR